MQDLSQRTRDSDSESELQLTIPTPFLLTTSGYPSSPVLSSETKTRTSHGQARSLSTRLFPSLPSELLTSIIRLSLEPIGYEHKSKRHEALRRCSLVCHTWRELAQCELFASVELTDKRTADDFLRAVSSRRSLGVLVHRLCLGSSPRIQDSLAAEDLRIAEVLGACGHVKEVFVFDVDNFDLNSFAGAMNLRTLVVHGNNSDYKYRSLQDPSFPLLRHLSLDICESPEWVTTLLSDVALPSLRTLHLSMYFPPFPEASLRLFRQLDVLSLSIEQIATTSVELPKDTPVLWDVWSVRAFSDRDNVRSHRLERLGIQHLRIGGLSSGRMVSAGNLRQVKDLAKALEDGIPALKALRSLYLPVDYEVEELAVEAKAIKDRGIRIRYEDSLMHEFICTRVVSPDFWRVARDEKQRRL